MTTLKKKLQFKWWTYSESQYKDGLKCFLNGVQSKDGFTMLLKWQMNDKLQGRKYMTNEWWGLKKELQLNDNWLCVNKLQPNE